MESLIAPTGVCAVSRFLVALSGQLLRPPTTERPVLSSDSMRQKRKRQGRDRPAGVKGSENRNGMQSISDHRDGILVETASQCRIAGALTAWGYFGKLEKGLFVRSIPKSAIGRHTFPATPVRGVSRAFIPPAYRGRNTVGKENAPSSGSVRQHRSPEPGTGHALVHALRSTFNLCHLIPRRMLSTGPGCTKQAAKYPDPMFATAQTRFHVLTSLAR